MAASLVEINASSKWSHHYITIWNANCIVTVHNHPVLRDLEKHVVPFVNGQWYDLGLELLDPKYAHELDLIEADMKGSSKTCCRKMFSKWLKTEELANWQKLSYLLDWTVQQGTLNRCYDKIYTKHILAYLVKSIASLKIYYLLYRNILQLVHGYE